MTDTKPKVVGVGGVFLSLITLMKQRGGMKKI